jgi:hypothetical protein
MFEVKAMKENLILLFYRPLDVFLLFFFGFLGNKYTIFIYVKSYTFNVLVSSPIGMSSGIMPSLSERKKL